MLLTSFFLNNGRTSQPGGVSSPDILAVSSISAASIAFLSCSILYPVPALNYIRHPVSCVWPQRENMATARVAVAMLTFIFPYHIYEQEEEHESNTDMVQYWQQH